MALKLEDIIEGDEVVYIPEKHQKETDVHLFKNKGVVTSVNDRFAFVRYRDHNNSQATRAADLIEDTDDLDFVEDYSDNNDYGASFGMGY